jgi:PAS domain S-box-containing protein
VKILHLEDDPFDAELLGSTLSDSGLSCEIVHVAREAEFLDALGNSHFDLIISDFSMPGFDGRSALAIARRQAPDTPFIFVSGTIGEEAAVDSLLGGATDYVLKHKFARLVPAVQRALREARERHERILGEQALRASEERYRQLFASNPHPMWVYEVETGSFLAANDAAFTTYGYTSDEFLAMRMQDLQDDGESQARRHKKKDGTFMEVEMASHEISFDGRKAMLVSAIDVTEKRKVQAQFLRTQRMETVGTLAGGIAHDLNNVLAPILMAVQVLKERHPEESSRRLIETLESSAIRGAGIVRQVLTFARGAEGDHVPVQSKHLLTGVDKMIRETFPKSIRLETDFAKGLWTVMGDPTQLDQVLLNLCVNARDAMPQGGLLKIRAENTFLDDHYAKLDVDARPGPYVKIEVSDTGQGIPPDIQDKIFEPFFTTKGVGKGTGLGLSTVVAIVKSHGGFLNVYSEPGKGTSFRVYLPAKVSPEIREGIANREQMPGGNGELIMVVDDEAAVRDITQLTLESHGYRVITARNGAQAVASYARQIGEVHLVLLDMMMPIMDGPASIHALKTLDPNVRIIAASGLLETASAIANTPGDSPVRAVLAKPYTAETLLMTLREVLKA